MLFVSLSPPQQSLLSYAAVELCLEPGMSSLSLPKDYRTITAGHHSGTAWTPPGNIQVAGSCHV